MKAWLANLIWDALLLVSVRLHDWFFSEERAAKQRFRHRELWWRYACRAAETNSTHDDMRARWWAVQFDFKTPPTEAVARGDLDPHARDVAMDAIRKARESSGRVPPPYQSH